MKLCHLAAISFLSFAPAIAAASDFPAAPTPENYTFDKTAVAQRAQKITVTVDGITFDSDYDNGSIQSVAAAGDGEFDLGLYTDQGVLGPYTYWFRFTMTGVAGRSITLNINHTQSPRPFIKVGEGEWRRTTSSEAPNTSTLMFDFGAEENEAEVAFFHPLGYEESFTETKAIADASPYASHEVIGQSFQNRDMIMVTVDDAAFPDEGKHRVWVHSRAHAAEVTSTHVMLGWLEQITEDSQMGRTLRKNCIFNIVPLLNVDGVFLGHTRWDAQGEDPERQWCSVVLPEVANMKDQIDPFMAGGNPIEVALNLHSTQGNYTDTFFFKHIRPSVTGNFETIQQNYIEAFKNATPLFNNLSAQTSQLAACRFIESYFWNNWGEEVMAMTHEGHYRRRITDSEWITGEDYRELGRAQARALVEYFGLELVPDPAAWILY